MRLFLHIHAVLQGCGGEGMPQIMKADVGKSGVFRRAARFPFCRPRTSSGKQVSCFGCLQISVYIFRGKNLHFDFWGLGAMHASVGFLGISCSFTARSRAAWSIRWGLCTMVALRSALCSFPRCVFSTSNNYL